MAEARKSGDDVGQKQVQSIRDEARKKGFEGESPSTIPNEAYSLKSGPGSPSAVDASIAVAESRVDALKNAKGA